MKDDEIKQEILIMARKEFEELGYAETSMRNIASKANLTTGSLYNRFKDKAEIFDELVKASADKLFAIFIDAQNEFANNSGVEQLNNLSQFVDSKLNKMLDFIYNNMNDFELIICKSQGSKYEDYIERFVDIEQANTRRYINDLKKSNINVNEVSEDVNHILASSLFHGLFQIVDHHFPRDEGYNYVKTLYQFFRSGWNNILGI